MPLDELDQLLVERRRAGMELIARVELPEDLAELQHVHLVRIVAELLTNAQRHGAPGPVHLSLTSGEQGIRLEVVSALAKGRPPDDRPVERLPAEDDRVERLSDEDRPADDHAAEASPRTVGGHGLQGLRERAELLGGSLKAGPREGDWIAHVQLPLLREGPLR